MLRLRGEQLFRGGDREGPVEPGPQQFQVGAAVDALAGGVGDVDGAEIEDAEDVLGATLGAAFGAALDPDFLDDGAAAGEAAGAQGGSG
ncbi:hypothetical protein [Streptomyces sp. NBC_00268]|uniref:hypothetical protein n=1 Tax=Streptomyces sp. NBC_00268 TaxID=2975695 RepID=UPI00225B2E6A|nr:hypothetical protein [Streptomyces sp. NBC_00268]MCX5185154.1 hypothetical protein [Streptomyces sp. NBC_00268]